MSSTKIVIIVLVLIAVIFIVFVAAGAFRKDADPATPDQLESRAKETDPPPWSEKIKSLFGSMKPKIELEKKFYTSTDGQRIPADEDHPFRTATFRLRSGSARIDYEDETELAPDDPLRKMKNPQPCDLPNFEDGVKDRQSCSILALKRGGTFKFKCTTANNGPCRVDVE